LAGFEAGIALVVFRAQNPPYKGFGFFSRLPGFLRHLSLSGGYGHGNSSEGRILRSEIYTRNSEIETRPLPGCSSMRERQRSAAGGFV
jgi:hypothetical protein